MLHVLGDSLDFPLLQPLYYYYTFVLYSSFFALHFAPIIIFEARKVS